VRNNLTRQKTITAFLHMCPGMTNTKYMVADAENCVI